MNGRFAPEVVSRKFCLGRAQLLSRYKGYSDFRVESRSGLDRVSETGALRARSRPDGQLDRPTNEKRIVFVFVSSGRNDVEDCLPSVLGVGDAELRVQGFDKDAGSEYIEIDPAHASQCVTSVGVVH